MSKEQIEEMAKILCGMKKGCDGCMWDKVHCNERNYAEEIYNAGYRKQSENTVELPCKVGTTVYVIEPLWYGIWGEDNHKCRKCEHFYEGGMGDTPDCGLGKNCCYQISEEEADLRKLADWITPNGFTGKIALGKTVFLTKEEAEHALAKMKGGAE